MGRSQTKRFSTAFDLSSMLSGETPQFGGSPNKNNFKLAVGKIGSTMDAIPEIDLRGTLNGI